MNGHSIILVILTALIVGLSITLLLLRLSWRRQRSAAQSQATPKAPGQLLPRLLIGGGLALLLVAGGLQAYDILDNQLASRRARQVLRQLEAQTQPDEANIEQAYSAAGLVLDMTEDSSAALAARLAEVNPAATAEELPPPSYDTIGIISISRLGLRLPVLSELDYGRLKVSVCRYMSDALDPPQRLVIAGHNYKSHFGKLPQLQLGDEVKFTRNGGQEYLYSVSEISEIPMDSHWPLLDGVWDLALFTCVATDRSKRVLVRCLAL